MPIEQTGNAITFYAFYTNLGLGVLGLAVTADVWEVEFDGTTGELVAAAAATEIGDGLYRYILVGGSVDITGEYLAVFKTAGVVDQQHVAAIWSVARGGIENLDATVSSRSTVTTAQVNTEVDIALNTAIPGAPTLDSINERIAALDDAYTAARAAYLDELAAANMPADLDAVLLDTGTTIPAAIAALPTSAAVAGAVHDEVIEGVLTFRQITRIVLAALAGISTGGGTVNVAFRDVADTKDRIQATVTVNGNRTAIALDGT